MRGIDWRELYATNQAAIARAAMAPSKRLTLSPLGRPPGTLPAVRSGAERVSTVVDSSRRALVHVPRGLDTAKPAPLVCMLHGCTQDPTKFAAATLMNQAADHHGFVVVYPGQDHRRNPQGCWNWFLPEHQQRDVGEPAAIATILRDLIDSNTQATIDPQRVFVAGLSSGGAMAAILSACYPDLFAAVAVHSGLAYRAATSMAAAFDAMKRGGTDADRQGHAAHAAMGARARPIPSIVIHGTADHTVAPVDAIQVLRQSMTMNHLAAPETCDHDTDHPTDSRRRQAERGHSYTQSQWIDARGTVAHELLMIDGLSHAWSGGAAGASHTDPGGPSATEAIWAFFATTFPPATQLTTQPR
jgi:poly(hydroxyalkanoate) depolymerase family esterase